MPAAVLAVLSLLLAACGGGGSDDGAAPQDTQSSVTNAEPTDDTGGAEDETDKVASTAPIEALRVPFESVQDQDFRLFDLDGELWLVDSEFSAIRIDPQVPISGCDTTTCLSGQLDFGSEFVVADGKAFAVETQYSPNQLAWIGAGMDDSPHLVQDEKVAPGALRGRFGAHLAVVGDQVVVYDDADSTIEAVDATSVAVGVDPVIATPIAVDPETTSSNSWLVADGETLWLRSVGAPHTVAHVDLDAGAVGPPIEVANEYGLSHYAVVAGGWFIVDASDVDEETGDATPTFTAYSPAGDVVDLPVPESSIRSLVASGDRALVVLGDDAHTTYAVDPASGDTGDPIDLGLDGDYTVTASYGDDDGVWLHAAGRDVPSFLLRIDLASGQIVERIELTDELDRGMGPRFLDGDPYFVLGDGTDDQWELVILGEPGSYGEAVAPAGDDDTTKDEPTGSGEPTSTDDPDDDGAADVAEQDAGVPAAGEDECAGKSLMECHG